NGSSFGPTHRIYKVMDGMYNDWQRHPDMKDKAIQWIPQTSSSPWKGGSFERLVGEVKGCLYKMTFHKKVKVNNLRTMLYKVANLLNNRPLFASDNEIITPNHLIVGHKILHFPPINAKASDTNNDIVKKYISHEKRLNGIWSKLL